MISFSGIQNISYESSFPFAIDGLTKQRIEVCCEHLKEGHTSPLFFSNKQISILTTFQKSSERDPFWQYVKISSDEQKHFLVQILKPIGKGSRKNAYKLLGSYQVSVKGREARVNYLKEIESVALIFSKICKSIDTEIEFLKKLTHRNIVQLFTDYRLTLISENQGIEQCILVEELMQGDLLAFYKKSSFYLTEQNAKSIVLQVLSALKYLNSQNIMHPDIKPSNCLVFIDKETGEITVKIADFENCFELGIKEVTLGCTPPLAPPELIFQFLKMRLRKVFNGEHAEKDQFVSFAKKIAEVTPKTVHEDLRKINVWGAGVLIHATCTKLLIQNGSISSQKYSEYPWSRDLVNINQWSLPKTYPKFSMSLTQVFESAQNVMEKNAAFVITTEGTIFKKNLSSIAISLLKFTPDDRISLEEAEKLVNEIEPSHASPKKRKEEFVTPSLSPKRMHLPHSQNIKMLSSLEDSKTVLVNSVSPKKAGFSSPKNMKSPSLSPTTKTVLVDSSSPKKKRSKRLNFDKEFQELNS